MPPFRLLLPLILLVIPARPTWGQTDSVIPDTLDWRLYFPLEIGNVWQYHGVTDFSNYVVEEWYETWEVTGDTLIGTQTYAIMDITCDSIFADPTYPLFTPTCNPTERKRIFLRYDEDLANIVERVIDPLGEELWFYYDFHLDAPFDYEEPSGQGLGYTYWYGRQDEFRMYNSLEWTYATVKSISVESAVPGGISFAHGIGFIRRSFSEGGGEHFRLAYARVTGQEYGTAVRLEIERHDQTAERQRINVYPNPSHGHFVLTYQISRPGTVEMRLLDVLGREIAEWGLGFKYPATHQDSISAEGISSGVYLVVVTLDNRVEVSRPVVIQ